ncbi:MAG: DNA replication initiation control protein YabA [Gracilibacteraceae bacterium]|jgi:regulator of replication initiation timing|nr:DNA replication initiation control protein YabA [Gracilibacteraceae bacterium]
MGRLAQAFTEVEDHVAVLWQEIKSLKEYVVSLEDENTRLQRELSILSETDAALLRANSSQIRREAAENLEKLYQEGFHVCHLFFGEPMTEPCLFCAAFLRHDEV